MVNKVAIIQARLSSSRLPGKVLNDLCGKTLLERVVERVKQANLVDEIWLATSIEKSDDILVYAAQHLNIKVHRGSLNNVLERFYEVLVKSNANIIVRVTADNPLTEPKFIDRGITEMLNNKYDYIYFENIPYGSGVEIINRDSLIKSYLSTNNKDDMEHVTLYIRKNKEKFKVKALLPDKKLQRPDIRVTIDDLEDYTKMYKIFWEFKRNNKQIKLEDVISLFDSNNI
jgi:spore coat polysaccharide biosynthesis protein SpsF